MLCAPLRVLLRAACSGLILDVHGGWGSPPVLVSQHVVDVHLALILEALWRRACKAATQVRGVLGRSGEVTGVVAPLFKECTSEGKAALMLQQGISAA